MLKIAKQNFKIKTDDFIRRRKQQHKKNFEKNVVMRFCSNCIRRDIVCLAHRFSNKCAACVHSIKFCDLMMSVEDWRKLNAERERFRGEITKRRELISKVLSELSQLKEKQKVLRKNASAMIAREDQNLKKMKKNTFKSFDTVEVTFEPFDPFSFFDLKPLPLNLNSFGQTVLSISKHFSNAQ